jgi:choline dehydrogenase
VLDSYDVIIVGAGSTGGTLAARLTENPDRRVLVLEAGKTFTAADQLPPELLDPADISSSMPGHPSNWAFPGKLTAEFQMPIPRGKVMGGSSSLNGAYFERGTESNFADWVALGNDEWSYDKVLPYYKRSETDHDFSGPRHGTDGPISVLREPLDRSPAFTEAFTEASVGLGFELEEDKNEDGRGGVGPVPMNIYRGQRASTALAYLLPAIGRENLDVVGEALVSRVLFEGTRAVGVETTVAGQTRKVRAGTVVVAAGALRSPQLLMLSGVGPADHLKAHGVDLVADLPGVGSNLTDHPEVSVAWTSAAKLPDMPGRGLLTSSLNWTAEGSDRVSDLEILPFVSKLGDMINAESMLKRPIQSLKALRSTSLQMLRAQAKAMGSPFIVISLMQEKSRGTVRLRSADPGDNPELFWNYFAEADDTRRLGEAVRRTEEIFASQAMSGVAKLNDLEASDVATAESTESWIRAHIFGAGHPCCSCKMGPESDGMAVVDQRGRVHGLENLMVADTSIFPEIPSRGPNATAIMIGEKLADTFDVPLPRGETVSASSQSAGQADGSAG